jgi:hypothetical protein
MFFQKDQGTSAGATKNWADLTPEEKREERFNRWLAAPNVRFDRPQAQTLYTERVNRFIKAIKLEEPDRVTVILPAGFFAAYYAGGNLTQVMYDYEAMKQAWQKFMREFEMDSFGGPGLVLPAKVLDMIDFKLQKWRPYRDDASA